MFRVRHDWSEGQRVLAKAWVRSGLTGANDQIQGLEGSETEEKEQGKQGRVEKSGDLGSVLSRVL